MKTNLIFALGLSTLLLVLGCSKTSAPGVARESEFEPQFEAIEFSLEQLSAVDTSFINNNHFACMLIQPAQLLANKDLKEVPWNLLEKQLSRLVGDKNAKLDSLNNVWVLIDRVAIDGLMQMGGGEKSTNPLVMVLEYQKAIDTAALSAAESNAKKQTANYQQLLSDKRVPDRPEWVAQKLADNRIVLGSPTAIQSILEGKKSKNAALLEQIVSLEFSKDVEAGVTIEPMREVIERFTGMMASMGGSQGKEASKMLKSLQGGSATLSLTDAMAVDVLVRFDDPKVAETVANMDQSAAGSGAPFPVPGLGGMMPMGNRRAMRAGGNDRQEMFASKSGEISKQVAEEIEKNDLVSIQPEGSGLRIQMKRPESLSALLQATITDTRKQWDFAQRTFHCRVIAVAMEKYFDEYGTLPPIGNVAPDNADGLPAQFNWRVGLLKFIDPDHYAKFDFAQPWDAEANKEAVAMMPPVYASVTSADSKQSIFQVVSGDKSVYATCETEVDGRRLINPASSKDDADFTAIVVQVADDLGEHWASPTTTDLGSIQDKLGLEDENGVLFVTANFKTRIAPKGETLDAVLTSDGGEKLSRKDMISLGR